MVGSTGMALPQDRESSCRWAAQEGHLHCRWAYDRSNETRAENGVGQDYVAMAHGDTWVAFAVCDGVGKSYRGDVAARLLGDALVAWLAEIPVRIEPAADLRDRLHRDLDALAERHREAVAAEPLPESAGGMLREVLERKRRVGSQAVFVAGRIDAPGRAFPQGRIVLFWLGDARLRVWVADERPGAAERAVPLEGAFEMADRWSVPGGVLGGGPYSVSRPLRDAKGVAVRRVLAYSDGMKALDEQGVALPMLSIDALIEEGRLAVHNDDASMFELFAESPRPNVEAPLDPAPPAPRVVVEGQRLLVDLPDTSPERPCVVWVHGLIPATHTAKSGAALALDASAGEYEVRYRTWHEGVASAWSMPVPATVAPASPVHQDPVPARVTDAAPMAPAAAERADDAAGGSIAEAPSPLPVVVPEPLPTKAFASMPTRGEWDLPDAARSMTPLAVAAGLLVVSGAMFALMRAGVDAPPSETRTERGREPTALTIAAVGSVTDTAATDAPSGLSAGQPITAAGGVTTPLGASSVGSIDATAAPTPSLEPTAVPLVLEGERDLRGLSVSQDGGAVAAVWSRGAACLWLRDRGAGEAPLCRESRAGLASSGAITVWRDRPIAVVVRSDQSLEVFGADPAPLPAIPPSRVPGRGEVTALAVSPISDVLAVGTDEPSLAIWQGEDFQTVALPEDLRGWGDVRRLVWAPDGTRLAVVFERGVSMVAAPRMTWEDPLPAVRDVAFGAAGRVALLREGAVEIRAIGGAPGGADDASPTIRDMPEFVSRISLWGSPQGLYGYPADGGRAPGMWRVSLEAVQTAVVPLPLPVGVDVEHLAWAPEGPLVVGDDDGRVWLLSPPHEGDDR